MSLSAFEVTTEDRHLQKDNRKDWDLFETSLRKVCEYDGVASAETEVVWFTQGLTQLRKNNWNYLTICWC
jgi:hypothetical protein